MAKPGSEAAHEEKLRELAGPEAEWVFSAPKKYPPLDAEVIERHLQAGSVCLVNEGPLRVLFYKQKDQIHGLVTELAHSGYRRRYHKVSGASVQEIVGGLAGQ
jgi:hypothetical protein